MAVTQFRQRGSGQNKFDPWPLPRNKLILTGTDRNAGFSLQNYLGGSLLFLADAVANPATTFYTSSAMTTPAINPGDSVQAINSCVGSLAATRSTSGWRLRANRIGNAPSAYGGADTNFGGFAINGINISSVAEMTILTLSQSAGLAARDFSNAAIFSPTSVNAAYYFQQFTGYDSIGNGADQPLLLSGLVAGKAIGSVGLWEAQCLVMHAGSATIYRLSARGFETLSVAANWGSAACANVNILGNATTSCTAEYAKYAIVNRALTASEAANAMTLLTNGVSLGAAINKPLAVFVGNSITQGLGSAGVGNEWVGLVVKSFGPESATYLNHGGASATTPSLQFQLPNILRLFSGRTNPGDCFFFAEGGNDITNNATTGNFTTYSTTVFNNEMAAILTAKNSVPPSVNLILESIPPRTTLTGSLSQAQYDTCRTAANNLKRSLFSTPVAGQTYLFTSPSVSGVYFFDSGAITGIATLADAAGANFADGTHYSNSGHALKAAQEELVLAALGPYAALNQPVCPGLASGTWHSTQRSLTSDSSNILEAVSGDIAASWNSQLPSVAAQVFTGLNNPVVAFLNGRRTVNSIAALNAVMSDGGAYSLPFPATWWVAGTVTGNYVNFGGIFLTSTTANPQLSGMLALVSGGVQKLGYSWNLNGSTYGFTGGPNIPPVGTRCLFALVVQSTGANLYVQTAAGQNSASQSIALAVLSPTTSTMKLGGAFGGVINSSFGYEQVGMTPNVLVGSDITNLWNSLA